MAESWRGLRTILMSVVLAALAATSAFAQLGQGRLTGTVTDAQGAVLPGVTVTAKSPALIGTQVSVTEADGKYRFPSLPSGEYSLTFELSGFQTLNREGIKLVLGQTITVDTQLQLAMVGYGQWQITDKTGPTISPAQGGAHYEVNALGFASNVLLPARKVSLGLKYFKEFSNRSTFQGYTLHIAGAVTF